MASALATSEARLLSGRDIMYPESVDMFDSRRLIGELTTTPGGAPIGGGGGGLHRPPDQGGQGGTPPPPKSTCPTKVPQFKLRQSF